MMQVEDPRSFIEEIRMLTSLRSTIDHKSCEENSEKSNYRKCIEQNSQPKHKKTNEVLMSNFRKKCIELGLEQNDESSSTPSSSKYGKVTSSDVSDGDSLSVKITKSNSCSSSAGSSSSTTSVTASSSSSSVDDDSEEGNASEIEEKDIKGIENDCNQEVHEDRGKDQLKVTSPQKEPTSIGNHPSLKEVNKKLFDQYSDDCDRENNFLDSVKSCHSENKNYLEQQNLSLPTCRNKSIKRKRENVDVHTSLESNTKDNQSKNLISSPNFSNSKSLKLDNEASLMTENIGTIHKAKIVKSTKNNPKRRINFSSSELQNNSKKSFSSPSKLQSVYSYDSHLIQYLKELPRKPINERKVQQKPKVKDKISNQSHNLLDQVAAAFAEQLSGFNLGQLASLQASQLNLGLEKQNCNLNIHRDNILPCNSQHESTPQTSPTCGTPNRLSVDTDDMLPIQAEVVMTDGSENEDIENTEEKNEIIDDESKINEEVESYLQSFISCSTKGSVVEYPPLNNEVPKDGTNLTTWQLEKVALPPFTPFVPPPPWLRLTIPAEGYKCYACGDTFFIESSLVQHRERRSIWISLECGPCDAKLTFYNKCSFKDHIYQHVSKGEHVNEDTVVVRSLPLQLTKLLQPIIVPVPQSLRPMKTLNKDSPSKQSKKGLSPSSVNSGKENHPRGDSTREDKQRAQSDGNSTLESLTLESPSKRTVKCYLCERMFFGVRELMSHMRTNQSSSDQRVECRKCLLVLPSVCAAKAHILTHPPANSSNISVCPECGSRCDGPRDFVHHLNTCGHQYRRSGILCGQCQVCFFKLTEDFVNHWIKEHCSKSYECVVCSSSFESLVFHKCSSPGQQVLATFKCLLTCPLCPYAVQLHTQEERETQEKIRAHLAEAHSSVVNRVHYVYKSKFCTNAFRSKDELRAHHDREHRRDNHYRTKTCTLHHEVLGYQHQYFNGQEPRNAFITMPVAMSPEEIQEAQTRDVPTVSSVIDKTLFPDGPVTLETLRGLKTEKERVGPPTRLSVESKDSAEKHPLPDSSPKKKTISDSDDVEGLRPCVCYRCGYTYTGSKDFRRHKRACEGEMAVRLCQVCGVSAVGEEFSKHCFTHIKEGLIICMYCNAAPFSTQAMLQQHFLLHVHEQFAYPVLCAFCSFPMPDVNMALAHLHEEHDPHTSPNSLESLDVACERCGRKFHGERGLNVHLTRCTAGTIPVVPPMPVIATGRQCQVCKKALTPEMFGKHIISHLEEGLLVCSLCDGLTLPSSMALLHHLEEHASALQYPSVCPMCSYRMCASSEALTHLKEDHGFGNLTCASCEMHYTFTYQLQRHIDIVHKVCLYAKRRYICWICRAYDHVKKETLMNHFRTVHGLSMQEVDEKVMIRTRGQGTMPTSQFIPTKPLGSKELGSAKGDSKADGDSPKSKASKSASGTHAATDGHRTKTKSQETISEEVPVVPETTKETKDDDRMEINLDNIVIKKELLDVINKVSDSETPPTPPPPTTEVNKNNSSPTEVSASAEVEIKPDLSFVGFSLPSSIKDVKIEDKKKPRRSPMKASKRIAARSRDRKLRDKTKVLIKRLPEAVLNRRSRAKKRKADQNTTKETKKIKCTQRKKLKKTFNCALCSYTTNSRGKFDHHSDKHGAKDDQDGFVCSECGQSFVVEPSLKRHLFFAHKIKQKPQPQPQAGSTKDTHEFPEIGKSLSAKNAKTKQRPIKSAPNVNRDRKITITIKNSPKPAVPKGGKKTNGEKDSELQCCVCKENFESSIKLYSHLRTHGMAFLKIGRKKRSFVQERTSAKS